MSDDALLLITSIDKLTQKAASQMVACLLAEHDNIVNPHRTQIKHIKKCTRKGVSVAPQ